ncbi:MAG: 50S ribosomal protein L25 [bacterium]
MKLSAEVKSQVGKGVNRRLRKQGRVPAILYGKHQSPIPVSLNQLEVEKVLAAGGAGKLVTLDVTGLKGKESQTLVLFKDVQRNALTGKLDHMDLYSITRGEELTMVLPIVFVGDAKEKEKGGTLQFVTREINIQCLPRNIPDSIEVDISSIEMGHSIFMSDIKLPDTVKLLDDPEKVVASIVSIRSEVKESVGDEGEEGDTQGASDTQKDA